MFQHRIAFTSLLGLSLLVAAQDRIDLADLAEPVEAGSVVRMDVPQLVDGARLVLEGRVVAADAVELPNGRVATDYTFSVDRTFWGDDLGERVVRIPGGVLPGGKGMLLPGLPQPQLGEELIVMLAGDTEHGLHVPVGLGQGRFRIVVGRHGERYALRPMSSMAVGTPGTLLREADGVHVFEYAELVAEIERAVLLRRARPAGTPR